MRKLYLPTLALLLSSACAVANDSFEKTFLEQKITSYEIALGECMAMGSEAALPDENAIKALGEYPQRDVEIFLITHAAEMEDKCASPQLGELAIALHLIEASEHTNETTRTLLVETNEMVFSHARWALKRQYLELPEGMKESLTSHTAFQQPFNSILIRNHLTTR